MAVDPPPDGGYPNNTTAEGTDALFSLTTGVENTAIGFNALFFNTTGFNNTSVGSRALEFNTTGFENTAIGTQALFSNTTGSFNTANGNVALIENTSGANNTANGDAALFANHTGSFNTATGVNALFFSDADSNTANGYQALYHSTTGVENTASGANALFTNKSGSENTAIGSNALFSNRFGNFNTGTGRDALYNNRSGAFNIALGNNAGFNITGSNNIEIGNEGVAAESNTIRVGTTGTHSATFIAGISGATVAGGVGVIVDSSGHLGTITSSARFKENIQPMSKASEAILALKPVTFRYKHEFDPEDIPQFGLVAEQVAKVNPDLVARDAHGKAYSVRYEAVNAMLLNEFLKEHRKVEKLEATVAHQRKDFEAAVAELKGQIQKVSAQLELTKPAPRTVLNNQ